MKKLIKHINLLLLFIIAIVPLSSCQYNNYNYFNTVSIIIKTPNNNLIQQLQANVILTNLNTKEEIKSSDFIDNTISLTVLRGVYKINVIGVLKLQKPNSHMIETKTFISYNNFVDLTSTIKKIIVLKTIFTN